MKRIFIAALAAVLMMTAISCGPDAPDEPAGTDEQTTVTEEDTMTETTPAPDGFEHLGDFAYTPKDAEPTEDGKYLFQSEFPITVSYNAAFNRWTLNYDSTEPLVGKITYLNSKDGQSANVTDTFYLEAGTDKSFSAVVKDYFKGTQAENVTELSFETANKKQTNFSIRGFSGEMTEAVSDGTYYLENERYRVGILLTWGGGISYIEDKQDGDDTLGNLINRCDTGRLVQQSYYGIGDGPYYTSAKYNDTVWNYNPVQGGDLYGNASRIVDFVRSADGNSVTVKAQPMDWAQNNHPCPAYMENTYTLLADGIRVKNRFVNFFDAPHPPAHQELPAFYVISNLGIFNYYGGTRPWTGDKYTTLPNEPFWGGQSSCYHSIAKTNSETWAAWTNTAGYGIGLFVPDTEIMLAGRFSYNGSKDPANGATNYVAPLRTMAMKTFEPFSYSYVISTGTVAEMRATFEKYYYSNLNG